MNHENLIFLKSVAIFSGLTQEELHIIGSYLNCVEFAENKTVFRQGEAGDRLYIIKEGKTAVAIQTASGNPIDLAEFKTGDFFGEMTIFEDTVRSATCYTKEKTLLLELDRQEYRHLLKNYPRLAGKIQEAMLQITWNRLQKTSSFLSDMVQWGNEARKRAITDSLSGFYNRRFLDDALAEQFQKAKLNQQPMCILMLDVDHFGSINERYSHAKGDQVIANLSPVIRKCFREKDLIARYGGDEFTFLLPDTEPATALQLADALCRQTSKSEILTDETGTNVPVTLSIGLAGFPMHAQELKKLLEKADQALYQAKERGRNQAWMQQE